MQFIEYFWGDDQQTRVREKLYTGIFKLDKNARMSKYALDMAKQASLTFCFGFGVSSLYSHYDFAIMLCRRCLLCIFNA